MVSLIIFLVLTTLGAYLLEKVFKVRSEDVTLMFAGAVLIGGVMNLTSIISLLIAGNLYFGLFVGPVISLILNGLFGTYLLKKSKAI